MIAALQMYDWPEIRDATDRWWTGLAHHMRLNLQLSRPDDFTGPWYRDDLIFAQTCGYPFTHALKGRVQLVATPHYNADGCDGPNYCSIVLAREKRPLGDYRGAMAAVNTPDSMSGMLALKLVFAPLAKDARFFSGAVLTGGHLNSMAAVREARADVCAIDSVCVALAQRYRPEALRGLVEIARSPAVPGLPWITRAGDPKSLREGLTRAFSDPGLKQERESLLLSGFSVLEVSAYDRITGLEAEMERGGGLQLL